MKNNRSDVTRWGRWLATFIGFPAAGLAARAAAGNIDTVSSAILGGLAAGVVLGAIQVLIGGISTRDRIRWVGATAAGFAVGLGAGAALVGYHTNTASLVVMGAVTGAGVGLAQALAVPMRGLDRALWALATPVLWAVGWLITSQVIVDAERQHAVFGGPGALTVGALTGVLVAMRRPPSLRPVVQPVRGSAGSVVA